MTYKVYLTIVEPDEGDSTIAPTTLPLFTGDEDESLACGQCKSVLAKCVSTRTLHQRFAAPKRLVVRCTCGAHNRIPAQVAH